MIRAIRDDEARVRFLGYHVESFKLFIFTLTAVIASIAGALYYPQAGIINPGEVAPIASIYLAVWVAIGGPRAALRRGDRGGVCLALVKLVHWRRGACHRSGFLHNPMDRLVARAPGLLFCCRHPVPPGGIQQLV